MCPDKRLIYMIYMGNGKQSHTKTSAAEQRVPTNWRQHSPKVDTSHLIAIYIFTMYQTTTADLRYYYYYFLCIR